MAGRADPEPMLESLRGKASDRKLRLFGLACRRGVWDWAGELLRRVVEGGGRDADGLADWGMLAATCPDTPPGGAARTAAEEVAVNARAAVRLAVIG